MPVHSCLYGNVGLYFLSSPAGQFIIFPQRLAPAGFYLIFKYCIAIAYFILQNRRLPKQAVSYFKFQEGTTNASPCLSIKISGKEEIIPFKDNIGMAPAKEHLIATFPDFAKAGNSHVRKTVFRECKPVSRPDENVYHILFKTSFGSIKVRFNNEEDLKKELASMDQLFDVE